MREGIYRLYNGSRSQDQSVAVFFSLGGSDGFYSVILRHKVNFMLLIFFNLTDCVADKFEIFKLGFKETQLP